MSELQVTGLADLQLALDTLPAKIEANILRGALRAGAKVQLLAARVAAPVGAPAAENARLYGGRRGALRDSLRIKSVRAPRGVVKIAVSAGGKAKDGADAFYARFVEKGTKPHDIKPRRHRSLFFAGLLREIVHHPGARPQPFMERTFDATAAAAVDAAAAYIRKRLTKQGIDVPDSGA